MAVERNQGYTLKGLVSLCASFLFPVQPQGMQRTRGTLAVAVRVASAQVASSGAVEALWLQPGHDRLQVQRPQHLQNQGGGLSEEMGGGARHVDGCLRGEGRGASLSQNSPIGESVRVVADSALWFTGWDAPDRGMCLRVEGGGAVSLPACPHS